MSAPDPADLSFLLQRFGPDKPLTEAERQYLAQAAECDQIVTDDASPDVEHEHDQRRDSHGEHRHERGSDECAKRRSPLVVPPGCADHGDCSQTGEHLHGYPSNLGHGSNRSNPVLTMPVQTWLTG